MRTDTVRTRRRRRNRFVSVHVVIVSYEKTDYLVILLLYFYYIIIQVFILLYKPISFRPLTVYASYPYYTVSHTHTHTHTTHTHTTRNRIPNYYTIYRYVHNIIIIDIRTRMTVV